MKLPENALLKILVDLHYLSADDLAEAQKNAKEDIVGYLIKHEALSEVLVQQAIAEAYKLKYTDLKVKQPKAEDVLKLPESIARKYNAILIKESAKEVVVATSEVELVKELEKVLHKEFPGKKVSITLGSHDEIELLLNNYKQSIEKRFTKIIRQAEGVAPEIIAEIVDDAVDLNSSDIHFEPQEDKVVIRFRIDGVLHEIWQITLDVYDNVLNRIKILANLRLDEHFAAQDGAVRMTTNGKDLDLRVSIVPTVNGQNIVIRILSQYIQSLSLSDLGLVEKDQILLEAAYKKPFGMILTVGPTGSGKTTTLYSLIKKLQTPEINITTIEDPVEYKIAGINQIQVNEKADMTFAKGLRSIVRQDPNVILVGEIRDLVTAEIAVNAALTGHLLLSTFHANDASTVIPRLLDMGVEPFLMASTLNLIVAQRLVRKICSSCRSSYEVKHTDKIFKGLEKFLPKGDITLYKGKGCQVCNGSGYKGRSGLFELMYITPEIQELIMSNPSSVQIRDLSIKQGSRSFFEDGLDKVFNGITSFEELIRVAAPPVSAKIAYAKGN